MRINNRHCWIIKGIIFVTVTGIFVSGCEMWGGKNKSGWVEIGKSVRGVPIIQAEFGKSGKTIIYLGVIHGDEPFGKLLLERLFEYLQNNSHIYSGKRVLIIPALNPDGLAAKTRVNANGVDINRNMPTKNWIPDKIFNPGRYPASEPETKIIVKLIRDKNPAIMVIVHQGLDCINYDGPATLYAEKLVQLTGLPLKHDVGYSTPGSIGTYAGIERAIPTITFEFPSTINTADIDSKYFPAILAAIKLL